MRKRHLPYQFVVCDRALADPDEYLGVVFAVPHLRCPPTPPASAPRAEASLAAGSSLLPAGVRGVDGAFERGDLVLIEGPSGVLGRGLVAYASEDARRIAGCRSEAIESVLGWRGRDEMVHRDDLVLD